MTADVKRDGVRATGPRALLSGDGQLGAVLTGVVAACAAQAGRAVLDIVDVGGGTGGLAVPLASLGHNVTVVDPSPDALAAAQRRAAEVAVRIAAVQGEAASADSVVGTGAADLVICHNVLEYVDSPADAMAAIARTLRPGGTVSVLAANAVAAVLHRALAGRFAEARDLLVAPPPAPRRFTLPELSSLLSDAGLRPGEAHGIRIFGGLVPGMLTEGDPGAAAALLELERAAAVYPALRDIAAQLHVLGHRS
ncbi:MAG TPA: class I SAM-dependent methyltransferase [Streptosporangiaceae bacterium]|nr:class I SAM-dependent methyltransferase [Streptosporangiaceae bacterium]